MAIKHPITAPNVETVDDEEFGFSYFGKAAALLAAGLAQPEWLPGEPTCSRKTIFRTFVDGRHITVWRNRRKGFHVSFGLTDSEKPLMRALCEERKALESMPTSADDFRRRVTEYVESTFGINEHILDGFGYGYHFDESTRNAFAWACSEALKALEDGQVIFRARERTRYIASIKQKTATADSSFQGFIATAIHDAEASHD